jgi:thiol-disulfide isomerase/thioredoxin
MTLRLSSAALFLIVVGLPGLAGAQATARLSDAPATQPLQIPPEAQRLLDRARDRYGQLKSLELAGTFSLEFDAAGHKISRTAPFVAGYSEPNRFRHEMNNDALIVCNGKKAFLYVAGDGRFIESDAPEGRDTADRLPEDVRSVLQQQNPSLLLAINPNAVSELTSGAESVIAGPAEQIDGVDCQLLRIETSNQIRTFWLDQRSGLLRKVQIDMLKDMVAREVPDAKVATWTIDYTRSADTAPPNEMFVWTPPADATPIRSRRPTLAAAEGGGLVGKPAPAITLDDLDGRPLSLASLKGSVVVLDFWATWCPPCRESMPHLDKLQEEFAGRAHVLAVNVREDAELVRKFLKDNNLSVRVLLDPAGNAAERFGVRGIPQTVIIGKNGAVQNVIVGFGPDTAATLRDEVSKALATN